MFNSISMPNSISKPKMLSYLQESLANYYNTVKKRNCGKVWSSINVTKACLVASFLHGAAGAKPPKLSPKRNQASKQADHMLPVEQSEGKASFRRDSYTVHGRVLCLYSSKF